MPLDAPFLDKDEIRRRAPLAAIAFACGIQLDNDGRGLCPFHDDRRPSFNLWVDQAGVQRWGCFPCQISGDCFDLVQRTRLVSFGEAVRVVAEIVQNAPEVRVSPPARAVLDQASLDAYVASAQARAARGENMGLLCVASSMMSEDAPYDDRLELDHLLRVLGWGVDERANVVMPHYDENYRLTGAKIRAIGGQRWTFPGSSFERMYGCWLEQGTGREWLVTEGETDFAWAWSRRPALRVMALPTGAAGPRREWLVEIDHMVTDVFLALDGDDAGDKATERWVSELDRIGGVAVRVMAIPRGEDLRSCGLDLGDLITEALVKERRRGTDLG